MYLPIFQTAGSVELAVNMIIDHVHLFNAEEDPARKGNHEAALRKAISEDVTVRENGMERTVYDAMPFVSLTPAEVCVRWKGVLYCGGRFVRKGHILCFLYFLNCT